MDEKRDAIITIALISLIILIFTVADFINGDRIFSETENRTLASRPEFSLKNLFEGNYTEDYESYVTDQFVSRDKWISMKTYTDIILQKEEINGVYLGADGYLIEQHLPEDYAADLVEKKLALLEKLVEKWDAAVMLVPTADNILIDKLPVCAPYYDERNLLEQVASRIGEEHYVDTYAVLREHADEEIYYRTDHHWTSLGAYYGYLAWTGAEGVETAPYDTKTMETVTQKFLGTLHSKVNLNVKEDKIQYFPETVSRPMTVTYDFRSKTDTCYEESYLDTKNKYGFFMDDNHGFVEIETDYHNGKSLFVIKDSYANCFVPLLIPHYERIYVVDLRYFNGRLFGFMEKYGQAGEMDVLVLYNCIHFLEEFAYVE